MSLTRSHIYEMFLQQTKLTSEHRAELRKKRGFNDETIDALRFRSGGSYVAKVIDNLRDHFADEDLIDSKILNEANGVILVENQLLDDRIIIPYLDEEGKPYFMRPHKLGFRGLGIEVYSRFLLKDKPKEIVVTEGEFKAGALYQWGIPGVAIPGISSFGGKHFDRLADMLNEFGVEGVTIIFDNEVKDNPQYSNYKEHPEDRWDTPFWAYVLASKLKARGFNAKAGNLPDSWREKGKIDFDGALAQGRTQKEIERVVSSAVIPSEFLDTLSSEAQRIVRRKVSIYFKRSKVRRNYNQYEVDCSKDGDETKWRPISNFVIDIKSSLFTAEGCIRYVQFVNEYGERSDTFVLYPGDMVSPDSFRKFCYAKGSYVWQGSTVDLQEVWRYELMRDMGDVIHVPEQIGEVKPGFWLFGNLAVHKGDVLRPDSEGIVWINGVGYKPQSLTVGPHGEPIEDAIPALYTGSIDIKEVAKHFRGAFGGGFEACVGIGWVVATLFSRSIFMRYKAFPFPFPHGKREAGKSTFMRWLMAFFGSEVDGLSLAETTQNYIMRVISYYSSLGVWFDEYRNEPRVTQKDGYLRSAYNRQLSGKGVKESFGARSYVVRGTIAISGEELPRDNGLFTRIVPLRISASMRDRDHFEWMNANMHRFSGFTLQVIKNFDQLETQVLATIKELKEALTDAGISDRAAENWAILAGCYYTVVDQDEEFIRWVRQTASEIRKEAEDEHLLNVFWSDVSVMVTEREVGKDYLALTDDNNLAVWFAGLYIRWSEYYRKRTGREPFDRMSIRRYMSEEAYFNGEKAHRLAGTPRKCIVIDLEKAPDSVQEVAIQLTEWWQDNNAVNS